jgi:tetratricopeptide (TPR) repeat protein
LRADALRRQGRHRQALRDYRQWLRRNPDSVAVRFEMALCYCGLGRHAEALEELCASEQTARGEEHYYTLRGLAYARTGDTARALQDYREAIKRWPQEPMTFLLRGDIRRATGKYAGAEHDYTRALDIDSADANTLHLRAQARILMRDYRRAMEDLDRAVALEPSNPRHHIRRGDCLSLAERYDEAIEAYTEALALGGDTAVVCFERGLTRNLIDEPEYALCDLEAAMRHGEWSPYILEVAAGCACELGPAQECVRYATMAIEADPDGVIVWRYYERGIALLELGKPERAVADLETTVERTRQQPFPRPYLYRARALDALGRTADAIPDYRRFLELAEEGAQEKDSVEARLRELTSEN